MRAHSSVQRARTIEITLLAKKNRSLAKEVLACRWSLSILQSSRLASQLQMTLAQSSCSNSGSLNLRLCLQTLTPIRLQPQQQPSVLPSLHVVARDSVLKRERTSVAPLSSSCMRFSSALCTFPVHFFVHRSRTAPKMRTELVEPN